MLIEAPVSLGELVDKITILELKAANIVDPIKLANVSRELSVLNTRLSHVLDAEQLARLAPLKLALVHINQTLWTIEDEIRDCERSRRFEQAFIDLARAVYITNDKRASLKKDINLAFGSELVEEKAYREYQ